MVGRFLRRPPGLLVAAGTLVAAAGICWSNSSFGTAFGTGLLGLAVGAVVLVCWLIRTLASAVTARRFFLRTLLVPLIFGLTLVAVQVDAPTRLRFAQARPGFQDAVRAIEGGTDPAQFERRIGTYRVSTVWRSDSNVYFTLEGGFLGSSGLVFLPDGPPDPPTTSGQSHTSYSPVRPPWYQFSSTYD